MRASTFVLVAALATCGSAATQSPQEANYDEAKVPRYTLPDPLTLANGQRVTTAETWRTKRRPELLDLFARYVYGRSAAAPSGLKFEVRGVDRKALAGTAVRKLVTMLFAGTADGPRMDLLIYLPAAARGPVPAFLGLNFNGNHAVTADPGVTLSTRWMRPNTPGLANGRATDASRGNESASWPIELILSKGFALVTVYCGDLEPDHPEGWREGIRTQFFPPPTRATTLPNGATAESLNALRATGPDAKALDAWGALGAWAWGLSRALDYLQTDQDIDGKRVAVIGHSRLGKAAMWAAAQDERFALVVSNESGEGGVAITRRKFGETLARITTAFPHWFAGIYSHYGNRENDLPVDFHELVALAAPRPVYIGSAADDQWADPRGEFLAGLHAEPVYKLLGTDGLGVADMPPVDTPVGRTIAYHVRTGKHSLTRYDWEQYLAFAQRHLSKR